MAVLLPGEKNLKLRKTRLKLKQNTNVSAAKGQKKAPTLKITKINFPATYELVDWPEGCIDPPTYFQLISTLEIIKLYKETKEPEKFGKANAKRLEKWLQTNSIEKFEAAVALADEVSLRLESIKYDFIETNMQFPMNRRRQDH